MSSQSDLEESRFKKLLALDALAQGASEGAGAAGNNSGTDVGILAIPLTPKKTGKYNYSFTVFGTPSGADTMEVQGATKANVTSVTGGSTTGTFGGLRASAGGIATVTGGGAPVLVGQAQLPATATTTLTVSGSFQATPGELDAFILVLSTNAARNYTALGVTGFCTEIQ